MWENGQQQQPFCHLGGSHQMWARPLPVHYLTNLYNKAAKPSPVGDPPPTTTPVLHQLHTPPHTFSALYLHPFSAIFSHFQHFPPKHSPRAPGYISPHHPPLRIPPSFSLLLFFTSIRPAFTSFFGYGSLAGDIYFFFVYISSISAIYPCSAPSSGFSFYILFCSRPTPIDTEIEGRYRLPRQTSI